MTVAELIQQLEQYPGHREVHVEGGAHRLPLTSTREDQRFDPYDVAPVVVLA